MYITLDSIVKGALLNKGYSLHWYFRFLNYGANCVQQLGFNTLKNVNTTLVTVNEFGEGRLPRDYVDWVKVGVQRGQFIKPLTQADSLNMQPNIDENGDQQKRGRFGYNDNYFYPSYGIAVGENSGYFNGYYGYANTKALADSVYLGDGFKIDREQGIIKFSEYRSGQKIVMEYISNTQCADLMTKINPLAKFAIQAFIEWKLKANNRNSGQGEIAMAKQEWLDEWRKLRASLNPLTCDDIMRIFREGYTKGARG